MLQQALAERLLPPLLIMNDRQPCTRDSWPKRRQELLRRLETHIYGVTPPAPDDVESQLLRQDDHDLADKAITRQILLRLKTPVMTLKMGHSQSSMSRTSKLRCTVPKGARVRPGSALTGMQDSMM